jgi:hypothetical protein
VDKKTKALFSEIMREIGSRGGKIGGKRSLETMTAEETFGPREEGVRGGSEEANRETTHKST